MLALQHAVGEQEPLALLMQLPSFCIADHVAQCHARVCDAGRKRSSQRRLLCLVVQALHFHSDC